ncbi:hypothetical protein AHiyo1_44170 [Arthrobacter sp. Hiyo1]|nr:hypothetical protein [Arthrobacter sp. Hiyo1]GAP60821.1 hypothetical protein AHiyo1_44170 [Arthrobacter sp. Hiyo1]
MVFVDQLPQVVFDRLPPWLREAFEVDARGVAVVLEDPVSEVPTVIAEP